MKPPKSSGDHFHFIDPDKPETLQRLVPEKSSVDFLASRENWLLEQERRDSFDNIIVASGTVGLIINPEPTPTSDVILLGIQDAHCLGAHEDDDEIRGRYIFRASLYSVAIKGRTTEDLESREDRRVNVKKLGPQQRWCVF